MKLQAVFRTTIAALLLAAAPAAAQLPAPAVSSPRPFRLGGYGGVVLGDARYGSGPYRSDMLGAAVALLVSGSFGRASYFGEYEPASRTRETWSGRFEDRASSLERLYGESAFADALRLRVGRFLTPVGQWNEIHAEPLTWTALRPLTTYRPFSKSTTGFMLAGTVPLGLRDAGYAVFYSPFHVGGDGGQETDFTSAAGGRLAVEVLPQLYIGASVLRYRASRPQTADQEDSVSTEVGSGEDGLPTGGTLPDQEQPDTREQDPRPRTLLGADASFSHGRLELLAEGVAVSASGGTEGRPAERGGFVQGAFRVLPATHLVLRAEHYGPIGVPGTDLNVYTLGAAVRPNPHLTLKLDRQLTSRRSSRVADGWFASASAIF